jgi:phosphonate transport system substrate-binding protein
MQAELLIGDTHDQFEALAPDVAFICGLPYVLLARQPQPPVEPLAAPVLVGERFADRPIYFSDVIVRHDSPLTCFADVRGHSWAYNEQVSQSGYGITRHTLLKMGETQGFFSRVVNAGWHQRAIRWVAAGEVEAAAIDCQVLAVEQRDHPELLSQIKVIDTLGPSTIQPVVVRVDLPTDLKLALRSAFVTLHSSPQAQAVLAQGFFKRFVAVDDHDYDDIRAMLAAAEQAQFLILT